MESDAEKSQGTLKTFWWLLGFLGFIGILALASTRPPHLIIAGNNQEATKVIFEEPFVLHFSESMNKRTVQSAFTITPKIAGKFKWSDSKTLEFHPEKLPEIGNEYQIKIKTTARSLWFKKMEEENLQDFLVTGPPTLIFKNPSNKAAWDQEKVITVMFDRPMAFDQIKLSSLLKTQPKLEGDIKILGLSGFQFIPKNLDSKIAYRIEVPGNLPAIDGGKTKQGIVWTIEPSANTVIKTLPEQNEIIGLSENLEIEFTQPINLNNIQPGKNIQLFPSNDLEGTTNDGFFNTEVRYAINEKNQPLNHRLVFTPAFPFRDAQEYKLVLKASEALGLKEDFTLTFKTSENLERLKENEDDFNSGGSEVQLFISQSSFQSEEVFQAKGLWRIPQNGQLTLPVSEDPLELRFLDSNSKIVLQKNVEISGTGSFEFKFPLSEDLEEGGYKVMINNKEGQTLSPSIPIFIEKEASEIQLEWTEIQSDQNPVFMLQASLANGLPAAELEGNYFLYRKPLENFTTLTPHDTEVQEGSCRENCLNWEKLLSGNFKFNTEGKIRLGLVENDEIMFKNGYEYQWIVEVKGERGEKIHTLQGFEITEEKMAAEIKTANLENSPFLEPTLETEEIALQENDSLSLSTSESLKIEVESYKSKLGEEMTLNFHLTDVQNRPIQGELTLNMLEGAVGIQHFSAQNFLPNYPLAPFSFFSSQAQSIYFKPSLKTDKNGDATMTLELPETTKNIHLQIIAAATTAQISQFGYKQIFIPKTGLSLKPILPKVLLPGDETIFATLVKNNSNAGLNTQIRLNSSYISGVSFAKDIFLEPGEEKKVNFKVKINSNIAPEIKEMEVSFLSEKTSVTRSVALKQNIGSFDLIKNTFPEGTSSTLLTASEKLYKENEKLSFMLSLSPSGMIELWREALNKEETDNLYLQAVQILVSSQGNLKDTEELTELSKKVEALIAKMEPTGGFAWIKNGKSDPNLTAMILLAISKANEEGAIVSETLIEKSLTYLLSARERQDLSFSEKAFIAWVLSEEGQYDTEKTLLLYKKTGKNEILAKAFLLLNLENLRQAGQKSVVPFMDDLKKDLLLQASRNKDGTFFEDQYGHKALPTALVVYALAHLDAENPALPDFISYLSQQETNFEDSLNPAQALWTILGLEAFMEKWEAKNLSLKAQIKLNGENLFNRNLNLEQAQNIYKFYKSVSSLDSKALNHLLIKKEGPGKLYVDAHWTGILRPENLERREEGIILVNQIYRADDPLKIAVQQLQKGSTYMTQLLMVVPHNLSAVKMIVPSNGGSWLRAEMAVSPFEIEKSSGGDLIYFAPQLRAGVYKIEAKMQALIPGIYHQFPATLQTLNEPGTFARTEGSMIKILE